MKIAAIKTEIINSGVISLTEFLDKYIPRLESRSVIVISSKVLSIIEGNVMEVPDDTADIIRSQSEYISTEMNQYDHFLTIKHNAFISGSGIDRSNGNGKLILLPQKPYDLAKLIYDHLFKKHNIEDFGVIITDSHSTPLRRGAVGISIGFHGFAPLHDYVGEQDLFGRDFAFEKANLVDQLAGAANLAMGEGNQGTPIAVVSGLDQLVFGRDLPTDKQLQSFLLSLEEDLYHKLYEGKFTK